MSRNSKYSARIDSGLVELKSKFDAEFRRFSVPKQGTTYEEFYKRLEELHGLHKVPFLITYTDPEGDLLPINNDDNYLKALSTARPVIRLCIQRKGESMLELNGFGTVQRKKNPLISRLINSEPRPMRSVQISQPEDFRRVSAIIDVDIIPETHRRVKLIKSGSDKPLGFYIRDGTSVRVTPHGLEKVPGVFISRLIPGGLAEMTGLLAVNDEVLEVNGIEVAGKTLDQVTDMMVANSANLIITVKPVNQRNNISPRRGGSGRLSQKSTGSYASAQSQPSSTFEDSGDDGIPEEREDEVKDYNTTTSTTTTTGTATAANTSLSSSSSQRGSNKDLHKSGGGRGSNSSSRGSSRAGSMARESKEKSPLISDGTRQKTDMVTL